MIPERVVRHVQHTPFNFQIPFQRHPRPWAQRAFRSLFSRRFRHRDVVAWTPLLLPICLVTIAEHGVVLPQEMSQSGLTDDGIT